MKELGMSIKEIKMLIEVERGMDSGEISFIICDNQRWAFPKEIIEAVGLKSGDCVSSSVRYQMQLLNLAYLDEKIAIERVKREAEEICS